MKKLDLLLILLLFNCAVFAQTRQVSGTVQDSASGGPVPSATVKVVGKNIIAATNADGTFSLTLPAGSAVLQVSSVGYSTQEVPVDATQNNLLIILGKASSELREVVVTALGISKDSRKVGYAVSTINGEQLNKARETNIANSLSGRVAGLKVTGTSSGPGGTAKILLRGLPSMNSGGAPLFVINGVPMDNTQRGSSGEWGGADNGDGIGNLNPDDIESMTVLKGQSASALYGARASNGVILVTTKSGKKGTFSVDYNINAMADKAFDNTDFQYTYGQGIGGVKPANAATAQQTTRLSWGGKLDGSQVTQFDGKQYPYSPVTDNISRFYRTGVALTNTVAVTRGGEGGSFRLSLSSLDAKSIVRNSGLDRKTINLNLDQKITDKLSVNLVANYIDEQSKNRPQLSDGPMNANNGQFIATNIDLEMFRPGFDPATGYETAWGDDAYATNPWFVVNQYVNNVGRKRLISSVTARYNITDWLYAQGRVGYDLLNDRLFKVEPWGTAYTTDRRGNLQDLAKTQTYELNVDGLIGATKKITKDITIDAAVGANMRKNEMEKVRVAGGPFILPYLYTLSNVQNVNTNPNDNYDFEKKQVNSAYYTVDLSLKSFLTIGTTGRYDAYSTMPADNRSIFTPSVSTSFIFSELLQIPHLSYGKLRASWANTSGELGEAYKTALYYSLNSPINNIPSGTFSTDLPNGLLKPFTLTEFEVGTELKMYNNRLGFDISYFDRKTKNEIMPASFSISTGYTSGFVGTGSTSNKGLEVQITGVPVRTNNFNWSITGNLTSVKNRILETDAEGKNQNLGSNRGTLGNAITAFVKGFAGPQILAYDYKYNAKGEMIVDASGYPVRGELIKLGSVLPTLYGGLNNEFNYKAFNFSFLIDYNYGNKILSATNYYAVLRGLHKMTLEGREGIKTGILENGSPNTVTADAQGYYRSLVQQVTSANVLDGDYIKLRQMSLGFTIPEAAVSKTRIFSSIQIALVGRNLAILMKKSDNIDPEASFGSNVRYAGIEGTNLPSTRSFGINANFKFKK
jgi:TonB-linked SusC/RagA family outer membrane protein